MGKKLMSVTVRGKQHKWGFNFYGDPQYLDEWLKDGLEVYEIAHVIPMWVVELGLASWWCRLQNWFNFNFKW